MGSAALYQLARRGARVVGLDQFAPPHEFGSTHGESRITRLAIGEGAAYVPLARRTHEIWRELEAAGGEPLLHLTGGYIFCPDEEGAAFHGQSDFVVRTAEIAAAHHIPHRVCSAAEVRRQLPMVRLGDEYHAYFEPTGGVANPERAVAVQLRLAEKLGAAVHKGERVLGYRYAADGVTVTTNKGSYAADKVIVAAGAWVKDFLPEAWRRPFAIYRQVFYWFEAEDLAAFAAERFPFIIWIGEEQADFYSIFPVVAGNTAAVKMVTEDYLETTDPERVAREVSQAEIDHMYHHFIQRKIDGLTANCVKARICLYTNTPDEHFVIDFHPESQRVIIASPCSGHGFKHSAAIGEMLAQLALEGASEIDAQPFRLERLAGSYKGVK